MIIENIFLMVGVLLIEIDVRDVEIEDILLIVEELNFNEMV